MKFRTFCFIPAVVAARIYHNGVMCSSNATYMTQPNKTTDAETG